MGHKGLIISLSVIGVVCLIMGLAAYFLIADPVKGNLEKQLNATTSVSGCTATFKAYERKFLLWENSDGWSAHFVCTGTNAAAVHDALVQAFHEQGYDLKDYSTEPGPGYFYELDGDKKNTSISIVFTYNDQPDTESTSSTSVAELNARPFKCFNARVIQL